MAFSLQGQEPAWYNVFALQPRALDWSKKTPCATTYSRSCRLVVARTDAHRKKLPRSSAHAAPSWRTARSLIWARWTIRINPGRNSCRQLSQSPHNQLTHLGFKTRKHFKSSSVQLHLQSLLASFMSRLFNQCGQFCFWTALHNYLALSSSLV